jgi:glycosyltransferase involved in cell wall biosynthesis
LKKLIIQIPAYNEAGQLAATIAELPREIAGVDRVAILVIDDGSEDETAQVAAEAGADYVVRYPLHRGLAATFRAGLEESLRRGADLIVNTDADNQYRADDIGLLLEPILAGRAEVVVGDRGVQDLELFSPLKRFLQRLGSKVIGRASGLVIPDATSGFRAFSREAALRTLVLGTYSYTLETLIQAGVDRRAIEFVPIRVNAPVRPSRLMRGIRDYMQKSAVASLRAYTMYKPLRVFMLAGGLLILLGSIPGIRFLYLFAIGQRVGHVQSLILAAILTIVGFQIIFIGLLADTVSFSRKILEEIVYRVRKLEMRAERPPEPEDHS